MRGLYCNLLKFLSEDDIYRIHLASMQVLEKSGIVIKEKKSLEILQKAGAKVDFDGERARIPQYLVEEAVSRAPKTVTLYAPDPKNDLVLEDTRVFFGTGGMALNVLDPKTGKTRRSVTEDLENICIIVNDLDNIDFFDMTVYLHDQKPEEMEVARFRAVLKYSKKHISTGGLHSFETFCRTLDYIEDHVGGPEKLRDRPIVSVICDSVSPLLLEELNMRNALESARRGLPVIVGSEALPGGTSPATLAGTLVMINSEVLAALTVLQFAYPGTPFLYGTVSSVMDMKQGLYASGSLETGMLSAAAAQVAQYYGLPIYGTAGMTDSKVIDTQSGFEKAISLLTAGLSGCNYIHDAAGLMEFALTVAYEQYVIDNEIIGMVKRIMRGIEVNDETLAVDLITKVGPQGNFLVEQHTVNHFKKEHFIPELADRLTRPMWEKAGSKDTRQRALEKAMAILEKTKKID